MDSAEVFFSAARIRFAGLASPFSSGSGKGRFWTVAGVWREAVGAEGDGFAVLCDMSSDAKESLEGTAWFRLAGVASGEDSAMSGDDFEDEEEEEEEDDPEDEEEDDPEAEEDADFPEEDDELEDELSSDSAPESASSSSFLLLSTDSCFGDTSFVAVFPLALCSIGRDPALDAVSLSSRI